MMEKLRLLAKGGEGVVIQITQTIVGHLPLTKVEKPPRRMISKGKLLVVHRESRILDSRREIAGGSTQMIVEESPGKDLYDYNNFTDMHWDEVTIVIFLVN